MVRLTKTGKIKFKTASETKSSRLGIGFEKLDRDVFDPEKAYDKVSQIGVKKIRIQSGWMRTEKERGVYNFEWLDQIVDNLISRGLQPWICLCYANPIYSDYAKTLFGAVCAPPLDSREGMAAWYRYVDATVRHFTGRISFWEIWNEPNGGSTWRHFEEDKREPIPNSYEYAEFAAETAKTIHAADNNAKVVGFCVTNVENLAWINRGLSTGLWKHIDYVSYHCYNVDDKIRMDHYRRLRSLLNSYNPEIGIIQGESGVQSDYRGNGAMHGFSWTIEKQVKLLLRYMVTDLSLGVEFTSYFSTMDMIEALKGKNGDVSSYLDYGYFGVLGADFDENGRASGEYHEKPSYYALQTIASIFEGNAKREEFPYVREILPSRLSNGTDCNDSSIVSLPFKLDNGDHALVYWNSTPILTTSYAGTVSYSVYGVDTDNVHLIDLQNGDVYDIPENLIFDHEGGGKRFLNIPITDSPLLLLFGDKTKICD